LIREKKIKEASHKIGPLIDFLLKKIEMRKNEEGTTDRGAIDDIFTLFKWLENTKKHSLKKTDFQSFESAVIEGLYTAKFFMDKNSSF
jgi:hypothetical protein